MTGQGKSTENPRHISKGTGKENQKGRPETGRGGRAEGNAAAGFCVHLFT
jgi:hypothetical protein